MDKQCEILEKIGRKDGMTVPKGYFDDFIARMSASLPEKAEPEPAPRTFWQKVRPYTYMAAMFAGIWCMMKIFSMFGAQQVDLSDINNHPGVLSALNDETFVNEFVAPSVSTNEVIDDLYYSGLSVDEIFGDGDYNEMYDDVEE